MAYSADQARKDLFNNAAQRTVDNAEATIRAAVQAGKRETIVVFYKEHEGEVRKFLSRGGFTAETRPGSSLSLKVKW